MLAAMLPNPVDDLADVEPVLEQMGKGAHAEADTAALAAIARRAWQSTGRLEGCIAWTSSIRFAG
jgi:hypothetical protein